MRSSRLCWQHSAVSQTGLARLLQHTATHAHRVQLPELYKLGVLLQDPGDILGLRKHTELLTGLSKRYEELREGATPFQVSLLDAVLPRHSISGDGSGVSGGRTAVQASSDDTMNATTLNEKGGAAGTVSPPVTAQEYYKAIMDLMKEVEAEHGRTTAREPCQTEDNQPNQQPTYCGSDDNHKHRGRKQNSGRAGGRQKQQCNRNGKQTPFLQRSNNSLAQEGVPLPKPSMPSLGEVLGSTRAATLEGHLNALEPLLRQLSPTETVRLIKTLAKLNYTNYEHTLLLTRRGCEVAGHLQRRDLCTLFFNLHRLHTRDSCVPIVNRILEHVQELTAEEVFLLCQSIERQENNSTASQRLLTPLVAQAVKKLPDATSSAYHRSLLVSMARYHVQQPQTVQLVLRDWVARCKTTSSEKDVLVLLEAATTLAAPGTEPEGLKELIDRLTFLSPTVDLWHVDRVIDLMSTIPMHLSTGIMHILLTRLENEAGKLSVGQLKVVLHLLSTYPPAKGHVAVVSLAYACAIRAKSMDTETLESIVISLAMLQLFTDDFFAIAHVLQTQKGGMRSFEQVQVLFDCCTAEMAALPHGLGMLTSVICTVAPTLNDEELSYCRKSLVKLGVTDRETLQQIFTKAKRCQRTPANNFTSHKRRSGYYDPMADLL